MSDLNSSTIALTKELISRRSVTPEDAGCQEVMIERLEKLGFKIELMPFGDVHNFWARKGDSGPLLCFAGHTDVVPTGPVEHWDHDPFEPVIEDGILYGRGAADMKGGLAAMITSIEKFIAENPDHTGSIALLITSDEEGVAVDGTKRVVEVLEARNEKIDWCVVGEPSSTTNVGDMIKNGRRGSLLGHLTIKGVQGHVAYPHLADNPVHKFAPALAEMCSVVWDNGNDYFPATSFQVANLHSGTGATNVIPGELGALFTFRFSTEITQDDIVHRTEEILQKHNLDYRIHWDLKGLPFLTERGDLVDAAVAAIKDQTGLDTELSTSGGTSDGRFIAPTGAQVVELGVSNATIHKVNECVKAEDLNTLSEIYYDMMCRLLA